MHPYPLLFTSVALFILLLHLHHTQNPQQQQQQHPLSPKGKFSFQEKTRLGSTPPSCHNKCNGCHPCMAVQVPSVPSRKGAAEHGDDVVAAVEEQTSSSSGSAHGAGMTRSKKKRLVPDSLEYFDPTPSAGRYSNYKPLGWKCRCGNHFYNP
ncbi:hypothetical protein MLD38_028485 [Melastoma candidum]|uniref:Uncharacterized protein n=1 Tax=Melastoma candidum TaxID=119954 RepID=A0ACB9N2Y7_9MYRT|nr:hypothetical protein MLD38_028485 [Melastoma candidum]